MNGRVQGKMISRRQLLKSEEGSFTLEASFVIPVVMFILMLLILASIYVYQTVVLNYVSSVTAERAAFRWDNSERSTESGLAPLGAYDDLYWRLASDGMLQALFHVSAAPEGKYAVQFTGTNDEEESAIVEDEGDQALAATKMLRNAARVPKPYRGTMNYQFNLMGSKVQANVERPLTLPWLTPFGMSDPVKANAARVVSPTETIRSTDTVRHYYKVIEESPAFKDKAKAVIDKFVKKK
jgi:hypothetical protein